MAVTVPGVAVTVAVRTRAVVSAMVPSAVTMGAGLGVQRTVRMSPGQRPRGREQGVLD